MRKIKCTAWISVDGLISGPDNDMSFVGRSFSAQTGKYEDEFVKGADTLILGRKTYESFAGSWPQVSNNPDVSEDERAYANMLNSMKKVVFSKSLEKAEWENSEVFSEIDADHIKTLKEQDGKDIIIYGSASIVQQLAELDLIDEFQLLVQPIVLGQGLSLFADKKIPLELLSSEAFDSGVMVLTYAPGE